MNCLDVEERLFDLESGRLDRATELMLHAHLESCASCRERVELWHAALPELQADEPAPQSQMNQRRMEVEIERRLTQGAPVAARPSRRWTVLTASIAAAVTLGVAGLWLSSTRTRRPAFATVEVSQGTSPSPGTALSLGSPLRIDGAGEVSLRLAAGATVRLSGPASLDFAGDPDHVELRLGSGRLEVSVTHRRADQSFAVALPDGRVEVRGTRFVVMASPEGSWVEVSEGTVAAFDRDGTDHTVAAPSRYSFVPSAPADLPMPRPSARPPISVKASAPARATTACKPIDCTRLGDSVRTKMRVRQYGQALDLLAPSRAATDCELRVSCGDELGYLRAEVLRLSGHTEAAVTAYKALDRRGAPATTRQNALYAAGQLERRLGRYAAARQDYEAALAAAPAGALREEAMLGAMEAAEKDGDDLDARAAAQRYLAEFPTGLGAERARAITPKRDGAAP